MIKILTDDHRHPLQGYYDRFQTTESMCTTNTDARVSARRAHVAPDKPWSKPFDRSRRISNRTIPGLLARSVRLSGITCEVSQAYTYARMLPMGHGIIPWVPFRLYLCAIKHEGKKEIRIPIYLVLSLFIFFSGDYFRVSEPVSIVFVPLSYRLYLLVHDTSRSATYP